jgi:pyruvate formate lyase activating enzyme
MAKGRIFHIEEFGVHDGPGVRKVVFFKGCRLRCNWCHNPEGMSFDAEWLTDKDGHRSLLGKEWEAEALAQFLLKGRRILDDSGGGITISGGEPLAQPAFLFDLMDALNSIHLAVETSGYAEASVFESMRQRADLVIMDLKHTDPAKHLEHTGVPLAPISDNLRRLCAGDTDFMIRIPLIPGVNDNAENLLRAAEWLAGARHLQRVELLPYHRTAGAKYARIGRRFCPKFDEAQAVSICRGWMDAFDTEVVVL